MNLSTIVAGTLVIASTLFASEGTHWGYTGHSGPEHWGDLDSKNVMCKLGASQSPINISKDVLIDTDELKPITFDYKTGATSVVNNGHTIQVNVKDGSSINIDGIKFDLKQFHFHTPSENQIDGKNFPLEAHFVHASKDGKLAVVSVMFEDGAENQFIKKIWERMPHDADNSKTCALPSKSVGNILPENKEYYRFSGSLTTPPCSEGVRWLVLKNYKTVSKSQIKQFLDVMHHANNRPIQGINARKIMQ